MPDPSLRPLVIANAAAQAIRAEHVRGSLEVGKLADLVVVGGPLFSCPPEEIGDLPIDMTVIGGWIAHGTI